MVNLFFFIFSHNYFHILFQGYYPPLLAACTSENANIEVVKALLAHPEIDVNKPMEVRAKNFFGFLTYKQFFDFFQR